MAVEPLSPPIRQEPPERLVKRTARVRTEVTNTIRVPHDRFHDRKREWYNSGIGMPSAVDGNQVNVRDRIAGRASPKQKATHEELQTLRFAAARLDQLSDCVCLLSGGLRGLIATGSNVGIILSVKTSYRSRFAPWSGY
jgi:hypothetical protein